MREIVLDTETTGLEPRDGHRIVEVGCVELVNLVPTGLTFHRYVNPDRPMPLEASAVHGLTDAFLADKPRFAEIAAELLEFLAADRLIIHNAAFDLGFLNAELERLGLPPLMVARAVDTVELARRKFPGAQASLDALCRRYGIDHANRTLHGALLDAQLLAEVYLELQGGRQPDLSLPAMVDIADVAAPRPFREPRPHAPSAEELSAHRSFLEQIDNPIWLRD